MGLKLFYVLDYKKKKLWAEVSILIQSKAFDVTNALLLLSFLLAVDMKQSGYR